jgi:hypothetical protein
VKTRDPNRTVLWVICGIIVVFVLGGVVIGKKSEPKKSTTPPDSARAVVVPTDDVSRTVVVSPCNTPASETVADAESGRPTPDSVRFELPQGSGARAVLIPHCNAKTGAATASGDLPAAAFVLPVGTKVPSYKANSVGAQLQVLLPTETEVRTVVVPPCSGKQTTPRRVQEDALVEPTEPGSKVATAPPC